MVQENAFKAFLCLVRIYFQKVDFVALGNLFANLDQSLIYFGIYCRVTVRANGSAISPFWETKV